METVGLEAAQMVVAALEVVVVREAVQMAMGSPEVAPKEAADSEAAVEVMEKV